MHFNDTFARREELSGEVLLPENLNANHLYEIKNRNKLTNFINYCELLKHCFIYICGVKPVCCAKNEAVIVDNLSLTDQLRCIHVFRL